MYIQSDFSTENSCSQLHHSYHSYTWTITLFPWTITSTLGPSLLHLDHHFYTWTITSSLKTPLLHLKQHSYTLTITPTLETSLLHLHYHSYSWTITSFSTKFLQAFHVIVSGGFCMRGDKCGSQCHHHRGCFCLTASYLFGEKTFKNIKCTIKKRNCLK